MSESYLQGGSNAPTGPETNMDDYRRGQEDAAWRRRQEEEAAAAAARQQGYGSSWSSAAQPAWEQTDDYEPRGAAAGTPGTVGDYFGALVGLPLTVGGIAALVAWLGDGDPLQAALVAGGIALGVVVLYGALWLTVRLLPLLILVAIVLWLLSLLEIGPGLPPY